MTYFPWMSGLTSCFPLYCDVIVEHLTDLPFHSIENARVTTPHFAQIIMDFDFDSDLEDSQQLETISQGIIQPYLFEPERIWSENNPENDDDSDSLYASSDEEEEDVSSW